MSASKKETSRKKKSAEEEADEVIRDIRPRLMEMIERNDPAVESACGQFGDRVSHARMRWTRRGAQALHQVKAAILSQDDRWKDRWPEPILVLPLPSPSAYSRAS